MKAKALGSINAISQSKQGKKGHKLQVSFMEEMIIIAVMVLKGQYTPTSLNTHQDHFRWSRPIHSKTPVIHTHTRNTHSQFSYKETRLSTSIHFTFDIQIMNYSVNLIYKTQKCSTINDANDNTVILYATTKWHLATQKELTHSQLSIGLREFLQGLLRPLQIW